ncbi:hypothetical protein, partial [Stenotrophomonas maltophilia]|uniref:hypothetical protein n=1 Tax=Stenotrophomonas maltophilia TaxID=40324 RepID=UPI00195464F2
MAWSPHRRLKARRIVRDDPDPGAIRARSGPRRGGVRSPREAEMAKSYFFHFAPIRGRMVAPISH